MRGGFVSNCNLERKAFGLVCPAIHSANHIYIRSTI